MVLKISNHTIRYWMSVSAVWDIHDGKLVITRLEIVCVCLLRGIYVMVN